MQQSSSSNKVRFAVVGAGNIAQEAVLPAFAHAESAQLAFVFSGDPTKRAELGTRYRVRTAGYEAYDAVCRSGEIDAVYVATPNALHRDLTERAARARVHVLCEKPMATSEADCEAMIRAAAEAGVKLMIAYRLHFEPANLEAIETARSGVLGVPRLFSSVFGHMVRPGDVRTRGEVGGGAMFDLGVYCINAARYIFGAEPTEVTAMVNRGGPDERFRDVDEVGAALLRFPGGRLAQLVASQNAADLSAYEVVGTEGVLRLDPAYTHSRERRRVLTAGGRTTLTSYPKEDQFAPEIEYFARCIQQGTEPEPSGREGLADVRVIAAIFRSAETGRKVELGPYDPGRRPDRSQLLTRPPFARPETIHAPPPTAK